MGGSVGAITFRDNLYCPTLYEYTGIMVEKRALDGTVVQLRSNIGSYQDEEHTIKFTWEPQSTLTALRSLAASGASFSVRLASSGTLLSNCRFRQSDPIKSTPCKPEKFFSHDAVKNTPLDLFDGELHIWWRRSK